MNLLRFLFTPQKPVRDPAPPSFADGLPMLQAALDAEKRLYESAVAALDQTFAKETLVVTFLTSGALVAVTSGFQACAPLLVALEGTRAVLPFCLLIFSAVTLIIGSVLAIWLVRGHEIKDLESGRTLLDLDPLPESPQEVAEQMITEFSIARKAHVVLVDSRVKHLRAVMRVLVAAIALALTATLVALGSSIEKKVSRAWSAAYTSGVKPNPNPKPLPKPAGNGTTLIKGGGGNGSYTKGLIKDGNYKPKPAEK